MKSSFSEYKDILPGWKDLRSEQKEITPTVYHQQEPNIGVKYDYVEALKITFSRTLETIEELPPTGSTLKIRIKDGVDGSGSHSIYHQVNNANTHNMIMYMFCLLDIVNTQTSSVIFSEKVSNSPHSMRPIFITMGKETLSNLANVKEAFNITRSAENTMSVWNNLVDENQVIRKRRAEYNVRGGLTQEPIIQDDLTFISPLHCKLRCFGHILLLIYHLKSETFVWTESETKLGESYKAYCDAKTEAKLEVFNETGIQMDMPDANGKGGTTNIGNIIDRLLTDHKEILVSLVPEKFQSDMRELLNRL